VWNLGKHYKWINVIAMVWVVICVVIFCLPTGPARFRGTAASIGMTSTTRHSSLSLWPSGLDRLGGRCQEYVQGPGEDGRRSRRRHADGSGAHANELSRETIRRIEAS